jgi:ATP-dependent RNA helicase RhlE
LAKARQGESARNASANATSDLTLVFARTKHGAEKLMLHLVSSGFAAASIHGNKSQGQRDRAIRRSAVARSRVLVATDVAARGIDIPGVSLCLSTSTCRRLPTSYVHRIGRTARAGAEGLAVSFCSPEETKMLRDIERLTNVPITVASGEHPGFGHGTRKDDRGGRGHRGSGNGRPQGQKRDGQSPDNQNRKPHRGKRPQGEQAAGASARPASRPSWRKNKKRSAA